MKTGTAIDLYRILKASKLGGLKRETRMNILHDMKVLRPLAEAYEEAWKEAIEKLKPDGYDEMQMRIRDYNAGKGVFTKRDIEQANALADEYRSALNEWKEKENSTLCKLDDLESIPLDDIDKIVDANGLTGGDMETLSNISE